MKCKNCGSVYGEVPVSMDREAPAWVCRDCGHKQPWEEDHPGGTFAQEEAVMRPMFVLTVKRDGGTQDVLGFYEMKRLADALRDASVFLADSLMSRRAIVRLEYYNPTAPARSEADLPVAE